MKSVLIILISLFAEFSFANMASPIWEGTQAGSAFSSRNIDITKEKISIGINKDFKRASYSIEYFIRTTFEGKQVPLLFIAKDFEGDFKIWVDGNQITLAGLPQSLNITDSIVRDFSNSFNSPKENNKGYVMITWDEYETFSYNLSDLKYFVVDLSKGTHVIKVEYLAKVWVDKSDWMKEYSFRYSLLPAKFWNSFDSLEISIDNSISKIDLYTNLGTPINGSITSISNWHFKKIPSDYIYILYQPKPSNFAQLLISIKPEGLTLIFSLIIIVIHIFSVNKYRKGNPENSSPVVIVGSLIIPLIIFIFYNSSFSLIDGVIGEDAGNNHGYVFLSFLLYPLFLPIYWISMYLYDRTLKEKYQAQN